MATAAGILVTVALVGLPCTFFLALVIQTLDRWIDEALDDAIII